jgi:hypothetical protein
MINASRRIANGLLLCVASTTPTADDEEEQSGGNNASIANYGHHEVI